MSTDASRRPRTVGEWITALVEAIDADPDTARRLRRVAADGAAIIRLDGEEAYVTFGADGALRVRAPADGDTVHGRGVTTRAVVRGLLRAELDLYDAVHEGLVAVQGDVRRVSDLFQVIELLLDASARVPALRAYAAEVESEAPQESTRAPASHHVARAAELDVLAQLDLLPIRR